MSVIFVKTSAKLNLSLNVLGTLENKYHDLDMVICPISMHDEITIEKANKGIHLSCTDKEIENDSNLVYRAAQKILEYTSTDAGVKIHLNKRIWKQAGLGGGSANAAGVLMGINELYELNLSKNQLADMGVSLGADVPLFLNNGITRVQGIGERVEYYNFDTKLFFVIVQGEQGLSTQEVFRLYDSNPCRRRTDNEIIIKAVQQNDIGVLAKNMHNCLQQTAMVLNDTILNAIDYLKRFGAENAMMTGSGSAVYGIFTDKEIAHQAENTLKTEFKNCFLAVSEKEYITIQKL
ncbi:MAG: 4-(cytidine 5'-diphospho)-2-C-methyl-D-erythritol kinase [Clostridia bacterium]|nr:4-(cytidine 5'-diphospho)-2-C-methyl-D-erythritol kinase [Clostridia bacterium]